MVQIRTISSRTNAYRERNPMTTTPSPDDLVATIACAEPGCPASTEVARVHVRDLAGRWRCRIHYAGVQLRRV
jgi:hypothetical protein